MNVPAMVGGIRAIKYIESHDLLAYASELGSVLHDRLRAVAEETPAIAVVRGKGLFIGVEFVDDDGRPDEDRVKRIQHRCYEDGVLVWSAGSYGNVLRLIPPLVLTERQADVGIDVICDAIRTTTKAQ